MSQVKFGSHVWLVLFFNNNGQETIPTLPELRQELYIESDNLRSEEKATILKVVISVKKIFIFWFYFHWNLFRRIQWIMSHLIYASVNWVSIGSGNGLLPVRHQAITWTSTELLSTGHLGTNFSEIWSETEYFSFIKMHLKMSSAKWWYFVSALMC